MSQEFTHHGQLLDQLANPTYVKDENHSWVYVNQAFCDLLGHPKEFLIGKTDYDTTPKDQADVFWEKDKEVFATKETNINIESTTNGLGEIVWVESKKSYFENAQGKKYLFGVLTDITTLKKRETDLEEAWKKAKSAEQAKSNFLANMSHEVRTPMNGIMGMAGLLCRSELPAQEKDFVEIIQRSGNALLTIINDILDFSKIEAGQLSIDPAPFDLRDCIEDVMALLSPKVSATGIDLLLRIQPDLPRIYVGDAGRIRQILTNIIGNAVKFTLDGHVFINVSGSLTGDQANLNIIIEDTGIGIPADKLDTIFDKFNQADTSTTREFGGTGLGLNIARELVCLMGGEIKVSSQEGKGSEFKFNLALPFEENTIIPKRNDVSISGLKVLVVDDNETNRKILMEQLNHWGCRPFAASSADTAISILNQAVEKQINFDLIITDFQMPNKTGEDFIRVVKENPVTEHIPSIMLSSVDQSELKTIMIDLGVDRFLTKPTRASVLMDAIADARAAHQKPKATEAVFASHTGKTEIGIDFTAPSNELRTTDNHIDVLIAEDNEVNQIYASYVMNELNLSFKVVPNGKVAVEKWKLLSPKIILMDISMPTMNGHEATAEIRRLEKNIARPRTPIIAVTAHSLQGDEENCLENDMDGYLSKPMAISALNDCLKHWNILPDTTVPESHTIKVGLTENA